MTYSTAMHDDLPQWLSHAIDMQGGRILCEKEVFEAPDGSWAVWHDEIKPVLGLPSRELAQQVADAMNAAFLLGAEADDSSC